MIRFNGSITKYVLFTFILIIISFVVAVSVVKSQTVSLGDADTVLRNGKIITLGKAHTDARALAIRDGKILYVGNDNDVNRLIGPETEVIDLDGRVVIPGLIDSHIHAIRAGLTFTDEVGWYEISTLDEGLNKLREKSQQLAAGKWIIVAGGWVKEQLKEGRAPTREELDAISTRHPIYIQHQYNLVVLNTRAMKEFGIEGDVENPPGGEYERDKNNSLTGRILGDLGFFFGLYRKLPQPTFEEQLNGTRVFMHELNRVGLTGFIDGGGGGLFPRSFHPLYKLWQAGELTQRVRYHISVQRPGNELEDIKQWAEYQTMGHGDEMLRNNGFGEIIIWGMHDGADIGVHFESTQKARDDLYAAAKFMAERGITLQIHAHHDYSAQQILEVFEKINEEIPIHDLRWVIVHGEDFTETTLKRMKSLGIGWGVQNRIYFSGDQYLDIMGKEIARRAPPLKTGLKNGLIIGAGTDSHRVAPYNPFIALEWLVTGKSITGTEIRGPGELPSREEALRMYTLGSAWMSFDEDTRGSLETGKLADLVVLSNDYMSVDAERISDIVSLLTMVDGKIVYAASPFK